MSEAYHNGRVVFNLTMSADMVARIDEMNGHQRENGRIVKSYIYGGGM